MALVLSLLFWGSAFPGIRAALHGYSPMHMAVFRFIIASVTLLALVPFNGFHFPKRKDWGLFFLCSFASIPGYHLFLNLGEQHVTASSASLILSSLPIWAILWSKIFLKEQFHRSAWVGVFICFVGGAIISFGEGQGFEINQYVGFVFISALCGSMYSIIQKKLLAEYSVFDFNCTIIWMGTLFLLPFSSGLLEEISAAPLSATLATVYLGIFPAAITFLLWSKVVKSMLVSRAVMYLYLIPVVATIIGWIWLKELPTWLSAVGGLVILVGLVLTQLLMKRVSTQGPNKTL